MCQESTILIRPKALKGIGENSPKTTVLEFKSENSGGVVAEDFRLVCLGPIGEQAPAAFDNGTIGRTRRFSAVAARRAGQRRSGHGAVRARRNPKL